jgi:hypothetical protein
LVRIRSRKFRDNGVPLLQHTLEDTQARFLRCRQIPDERVVWPTTRLQLKLILIEPRIAHHSRAATSQLA